MEHPDPIQAELERQLREGIGCLTCGTRFHAPSVDLDGRCPVCSALSRCDAAEIARDEYRSMLQQIAVCCDNGATNENKLRFIRKVAGRAMHDA